MRIDFDKNLGGLGGGLVYTDRPLLTSVLDFSPDILIETADPYILGGGAGDLTQSFRIINVANDTLEVPRGAVRPYRVGVGSAPMLRFGFGSPEFSDSVNGLLSNEFGRNVDMSGSYTAAGITRRPTAGEKPSGNRGGPVLGNSGGASTPVSGVFLDYGSPGSLSFWHDGNLKAAWGGEVVGSCVTFIVSYDAASQQMHIWTAGVYRGFASSVTGWGPERDLYIAGATANYNLVGDIGGLFVKAGAFYAPASSEIVKISNWLAALKAERN